MLDPLTFLDEAVLVRAIRNARSGRSIAAGETRRIRAGDFAIVPAGVPHWISHVGPGELLYFVVKVPVPR
jgi:mannose-6-phosphate isomerase-like protein (cupin superfamily)